MRDLKFKAWDKEKKSWVQGYPFHIIGEITMFDCLKQYSIKDINNLEIVQYTGLRDKNGEYIYEGDIVDFDIGYGEIKYDDERAGFYIDGWGGGVFLELHEFVIIGNIYENPKLLKSY